MNSGFRYVPSKIIEFTILMFIYVLLLNMISGCRILDLNVVLNEIEVAYTNDQKITSEQAEYYTKWNPQSTLIIRSP